LSISLEGEWGSGKSSFMLQLQDEIREQIGKNGGRPYLVEFNAWRFEKEEALWAAFALTFIRTMRRQLGFFASLRADLTLLVQRVDRDEGIYRLLRTGALLIAIVFVSAATFFQGVNWLHLVPSEPGWWGSAVGVVALLGVSVTKAWQHIGSPFEHDLSEYFDAPDYRGNRAFIQSFSDDFAKMIRAYVRDPENERVFVFIDDLDRVEVSRAADLLQALNLLLPAGEDWPIIYILGLDRDLVSAGLAAKFEKQLPYLDPTTTDQLRRSALALDLARKYVDKFVEMPFLMPRPADTAVRRYVESMTSDSKDPETAGAADPFAPSVLLGERFRIEAGTEQKFVRQLIEMVAPLFANNPRRVKQFLNVFRLQAHIAQEAGQFRKSDNLTLPKLAKATALFLCYPSLASRLRQKPDLLSMLQKRALVVGAGLR
jgi:hypothetical protein